MTKRREWQCLVRSSPLRTEAVSHLLFAVKEMSLGVGSFHSPASKQVDDFLAGNSRMITDGFGGFLFWAEVLRAAFYLY